MKFHFISELRWHSHNNEAARQVALQGLKQVMYPDEAEDKLS